MDFDFTFERIIPNAGNSITIYTNGSLNLPVGTTGQRPSTPITGMLRYNTTNIALEFYGGSTPTWMSISTQSGSETLTNKRITPRVLSTTSTSLLTINSDITDQYNITAQAIGLTIANPSGTPTDGQKLVVRVKDSGIAQAIGFGGIFRIVGTTLPTTTVVGKTTYIASIYNAADTKWDVVAIAQEA